MKTFFALCRAAARDRRRTPRSKSSHASPNGPRSPTEIGGKLVTAESATTPQQDPHYIQARPSLIAKVRRAQLIVCTGADLEVGWLPLLLRQGGNAAVQPGQPGFLNAADFVELLEKPSSVDRSLGDVHPYGNPHIQTDPRNIAKVAAELAEPARDARRRERRDLQAALRGLRAALAARRGALDGRRRTAEGQEDRHAPQGLGLSRELGRARRGWQSGAEARSAAERRASRRAARSAQGPARRRGSSARRTRTRRRRSGSAAER